ncbi:MAG: hypothetical protein KME55_16830 [Nostoc indistinguendum CM1-VF10]|jgi:SAM-dependent methyltransferase|nr:hypothetical protein [Nostoc indistinguendum CM1-VF10]
MQESSPKLPPRFVIKFLVSVHKFLLGAAQAILPPQLTVFDHIIGAASTMLLHTAAHWRIADYLHERPMSSEELAEVIGANSDAVHRMMRGLVTIGFFQITKDSKFENNRLSKTLRTDVPGSLRDVADYMGTKSIMDSWVDVKEAIITGKNTFEKIHQVSFWEWLRKNPNEGRTFAASTGSRTALDAPAVAAAYPFQDLRKLCDVGGGRGTLLAEILSQHSHLQAVLLDDEYVLEEAKYYLKERGVQERIKTVFGNFFQGLPNDCKDCDAYILRDILHDWDQENSLAILSNVRKIMKPGNRILIAEEVVEKFDTEKPGTMVDLHMMLIHDGRQRSREDFQKLFEKAGFQLRRVISTPVAISIVEGVAV